MPSLASSTYVLVLLSILSILTATTAGLPVTDDDDPVHGHLQRRTPVCDEGPNQNLVYRSCSLATFRIPNFVEDMYMTNEAHRDHLFHLPREFVVNECRISFSLRPEERVAKVSWAVLRARARAVVMQCVGDLVPGQRYGATPGRGGIDVYAGVLKIEVSHVDYRGDQ